MELYVGIDIGKSNLDVSLNNTAIRFLNSQIGIEKIIKLFKKYEKKGFIIKLVICEATGGYQDNLATALAENNYPVHVAHPNKVKAFASSLGILAKTDKLDAGSLSAYGSKFQLTANYKPLPTEQKELQTLIQRRRQLIEEKIRETNRLDKPIRESARKSIESHVDWIEKEIERIQQEINALIENHSDLKASINLLKSIPGIGNLTAAILLTSLPELGKIEDKSLCALAGVAPINQDSGSYKGKRQIKGGRSIIRESLYMATISSIRCNSVIKNFYQRLRAKGKPAKVAIVAAMHKLLLIINSVFKRQTSWVESLIKT
jgi:transposase